jgi:hypothetical protein
MASVVETTVFLSFFSDMPDHRQAGKVAYPLDEVLLLALFAVLAGAEETVRNFVPWRILLRHWEAFFEHDGELAFDGVPFAD